MSVSAGTVFLADDTHSSQANFSTISPKGRKTIQPCTEGNLLSDDARLPGASRAASLTLLEWGGVDGSIQPVAMRVAYRCGFNSWYLEPMFDSFSLRLRQIIFAARCEAGERGADVIEID